MVVLPAASSPTMRIRISFLAKSRLKSLVNVNPISPCWCPYAKRELNDIIKYINKYII